MSPTKKNYYSPRPDETGRHDRLAGPPEQARQIKPLILAGLHVVAELHHHDVGHGVAVTLRAALRVPLGPADAQDVRRAPVAPEEAPVVEAVRVDPAVEALRGPEGELHAVLVAHLRH